MSSFSHLLLLTYLTFFGTGKSKFAPGTVGSLGAGVVGRGLIHFALWDQNEFFISSILLFALSIPLIDMYERQTKKHDAGWIVIDEVVGVFLAFGLVLLVSNSWLVLALSVGWFRVFDVWKPSIIGRVDTHLKGGLGVMLDDVLAGLLAGGVCILGVWSWEYSHHLLLWEVSALIVLSVIFGTRYAVKNNKKFFRSNRILHPNSISFLRMPLALGAILLFASGSTMWGIWCYIFACITDYSDGVIARGCGLTTELGKSLDPLSDKVVYALPLLYFASQGVVSWWGVGVFLLVDILGQYSRVWLAKYKLETKANRIGKVKTSVVFVLVFAMMGLREIPPVYFEIGLWICCLLATASMLLKVMPLIRRKEI